MQFSAREDVEASIDEVFRAVSNFEGWERTALRRGAEIARTDELQTVGAGMTWSALFSYRNRERKADLELKHFDAPNTLRMFAVSSGVQSDVVVELVALSRERTRMDIQANLKPNSISARLLLQPMKLARGKLSKRFRARVADFAAAIEGDSGPHRGR